VVRFGFFAIVTFLLLALRALALARAASRVDSLILALNQRYFMKLAQWENDRSPWPI
jgi:hypothetical protein